MLKEGSDVFDTNITSAFGSFNSLNIFTLGQILYTKYFIYFLVSSVVLLVAMIGAIVLTLHHETEVKRQDIFSQISTSYNKTIRLRSSA